ncbi:CapA family protein [Salipaludibacillus sp. CUR1]|uniref:CapA family protein n=1 Tax=Salipaludibacillus sp. CUR1 TaxID=2820003 RepID=UPI001E50ED22|nr:CapA family protein [Salipaludibacillus sp. CUR1]MCE7792415.1 CapA family protein [Salipaludibacillus sp. CUR1]
MDKLFTYKERLLRWSKAHKKKLTLHTSVLAVGLGLVLVFSQYLPAAQAPEVEKAEGTALTASFVGDLMFDRHIKDVIKEKGYDYLFEYSEPYFNESDFCTGSFKHPVHVPGEDLPPNEEQQVVFSAEPDAVNALADRNFKSVSIANNNINDYGYLGFRSTVNFFEDHDAIDAAGVMNDLDDVENAVYFEHDGMTIATLGASDIVAANSAATTFRPGIMPLDRPELVISSILKAGERADLVIVHTHWGEAYDSHVTNRQRELARAMSRAGADVIIGHYPHVLAPVEVYNDTLIFYSLGNFIFDQGWSRTRQTALAHYRLFEDGKAEVELVPFVMHEGQVRPPGEQSFRRRSIERMLTKRLDNNQWKKRNGNVVIPLNHSRAIAGRGE